MTAVDDLARGDTTAPTTILGYPRIGPDRELKRMVEAYWAGTISAERLAADAAHLRRRTWAELRDLGLSVLPSNTFSLYDQVLDTAALFGAIPERFAGLADRADRTDGGAHDPAAWLDLYFAMAKGADGLPPLEMTKWFDTNYHYLVPELGPRTRLRLAGNKPVEEYLEARELGLETRPVLVGPLTFLTLAKPALGAGADFRPIELLDDLLDAYAELLARLADAGTEWVQLDEPVLAADRTDEELAALQRAYSRLGAQSARPRLLVATYFGDIGPALPRLAATPVEGIGLDLVAGPDNLTTLAHGGGLPGKTVFAGVVDGRNVWRTDLRRALSTCVSLLGLAREVVVSTSCSLLHVPVDLDAEPTLDPQVRARLAFARQKVAEVVLLGDVLSGEHDGGTEDLAPPPGTGRFDDHRVRARLDALAGNAARHGYAKRLGAQGAGSAVPPLPTTTIGSFPQTAQIRKARADHRTGRIGTEEYERRIRDEIDQVLALQEDIGLDVLVHGEAERNDMVQYFAERLRGFAVTEHGWVQSYGSRCVRPPILYGDVSRPEPMTVGWTTYAQSRTRKPVKGMLTGPVTMLAWSFVRDDQPAADTARQVALALRDEIGELEAAGIRIIQVDEPALREKLPLRSAGRQAYLDWAVAAFRLATSGVADSTAIHTHMCYSEFGEIIDAIDALDADVTSVEAARSQMELVADLRGAGYRRGIGPGVYDIHSPRVPSVEEMADRLLRAVEAVGPDRLWVNPDCGLKTRGYDEVVPALRNMVEAARRVRGTLPDARG